MNIILVSESVYMGHYNSQAIFSFALNFVVNVCKENNTYKPNNDLSNNETFKQIILLAKDSQNIIFIGFDYDLMGQAMAETLELNLIKQGIFNFVRTPYFDDGYITVAEAPNLQSYYEYLYFNQIFQKQHKESLKKILCLEALYNYKHNEFELKNPNGNSTITYLTKTLLSECY